MDTKGRLRPRVIHARFSRRTLGYFARLSSGQSLAIALGISRTRECAPANSKRNPCAIMTPKPLLSHTIAEWACALKYEHLSAAAIQAAKLFWFDSIGCALGGSQQDDAKILLEHYRAMGSGSGRATAFVSGFKTNAVDAAFLNGHMIRA